MSDFDYNTVVWPYTLTLENPVTLSIGKREEVIEELTFRAPQLGDLAGFKLGEAPPVDLVWQIAVKLTGARPITIKKLTGDDAAAVTAIAFGFFAQCQSAIRPG